MKSAEFISDDLGKKKGPPRGLARGEREDTAAVRVGVEALKLLIAQDKAR